MNQIYLRTEADFCFKFSFVRAEYILKPHFVFTNKDFYERNYALLNESQSRRQSAKSRSEVTFHHNIFLTCSLSCIVAANGRPSDTLAIIVNKTILSGSYRRFSCEMTRKKCQDRDSSRRFATSTFHRPLARNYPPMWPDSYPRVHSRRTTSVDRSIDPPCKFPSNGESAIFPFHDHHSSSTRGKKKKEGKHFYLLT